MSGFLDWTETFGVYWSQSQNMWLLLALVFVIYAMIKTFALRRRFREKMGVKHFREESARPVNRPFKDAFYLLGTALVVLSALGPQWGQKAHTVKAQGLDICFAVDLSRSMLVEDVSPSRLQAAKNQLSLFLPQLGGDRAALVGFAGSGYVAAPLSPDANALSGFLDPLEPGFISDQATSLGAGIDACFTALKLDQIKDGNEILDEAAKLIVLLSDGDDNVEESGPSIDKAVKLGVPVFSMAVGTAQGGPIALRDPRGNLEGYVKDRKTGQPVTVKLLDKGLLEIAKKTGGQVFYASMGTDAWKKFSDAIANYKRDSREAGTKLDREERFQWPLLVGLLLLLLDFALTETRMFRRLSGWALFLVAFAGTPDARAANPLQVWDNNQAVKSFNSKDYAQAETKFLDALTRNSAELGVRFNWATNKLFSAIPPQTPTAEAESPKETPKPDERLVDEALKELESLKRAPETAAAANKGFRKGLNYQLGQAYELKSDTPRALLSYYASLLDKSGDKATDEQLEKAARDNITRLLGDPDGKGGGGGGGGGGGQGENKDSQGGGGEGPSKPPEPGKDHKDQKQAPKFSGTEVSESEARQILESVSGEEREVQKRKAQSEAKQRSRSQNSEQGKVNSTGRDNPW